MISLLQLNKLTHLTFFVYILIFKFTISFAAVDIWNKDEKEINQESIRDLDQRVLCFKEWINKRKEKTIAVVSHGTFISRVIYFF